jgi:hypothetical protein
MGHGRMLAALAAIGCQAPSSFECVDDALCDEGGNGRCETPGVCSYRDASCKSGRRYGVSAGERASECTIVNVDDVVIQAQGEVPFARQRDWNWNAELLAQAINRPSLIQETGIHSSALENGETLRFGKHDDPLDPRRTVLAVQLGPSDPLTLSAARCEVVGDRIVARSTDYWMAGSLYIYTWIRGLERAALGMRVASIFSLVAQDTRFWVSYEWAATPSDPPTVVEVANQPVPFDRWVDIVVQFRVGAVGSLRVWMDGNLIVEYDGSLGLDAPERDFPRFGWAFFDPITTSRKLLLRSPVLVVDPGGRYTQDDLRAFVNSN